MVNESELWDRMEAFLNSPSSTGQVSTSLLGRISHEKDEETGQLVVRMPVKMYDRMREHNMRIVKIDPYKDEYTFELISCP